MELTIEQALQQGVRAHKEGNLQKAEKLYCAILQAQPVHPDANYNLGLLLVSINNSESALPLFKTALEANPRIEQFWLTYINALIKENQFKTALAVIKQGKKTELPREKLDFLEAQLTQMTSSKSPKNKKSLTLKEKRTKQAEKKLKRKKGKEENTSSLSPPQFQLNNLIEHYQSGQYNKAEKLAISITKEYPNHQFSWKTLGVVYGQMGRKSQAVNANQRAVKLAPLDAEAHSNLGNSLKELGRLEEAEASCKQAIVLKPDFVGAHNNLGITLQKLDKLEEAETIYRQAIAFKPDFSESHYNLSCALKALGRLEEAEVSCRQAIELSSNFAEAHNNLGSILQELGKLEEAEASYGQAIKLNPDSTFVFMNRWRLLFDQGKFETALKDSDFCNTKISKQYSLETLYALGRTEEVYQRIETESQVDDENIRTAAFAAFLAKIEKKDTANNFCTNPMDFIHVNNLASHLEHSSEFITELIEEIHPLETTWEPFATTTRKGLQTLTHINLFANPSVKIASLKSIIIDELAAYYLKFQNESCTYIKKWPSKNNLWAWSVTLKHQGHQTAHIHPGGWLSGVIYLKVVPSLGKDEGAIEFSLNGENYSNINSPSLTYQPKSGDIVFFPSSLHHRTIPFTTDTDRIIVSFDLQPGKLGKEI